MKVNAFRACWLHYRRIQLLTLLVAASIAPSAVKGQVVGSGGAEEVGGDALVEPTPILNPSLVAGRWVFDFSAPDGPQRLAETPVVIDSVGDAWIAMHAGVVVRVDRKSGERRAVAVLNRQCEGAAGLVVDGDVVSVVCSPKGDWVVRLSTRTLEVVETPVEADFELLPASSPNRRASRPADPVLAVSPQGHVAVGLQSLVVTSPTGSTEFFEFEEQARNALAERFWNEASSDLNFSPVDYRLNELGVTAATWTADGERLATAWQLEVHGPSAEVVLHTWLAVLQPQEQSLVGISLAGPSPEAIALSRDGRALAWVDRQGSPHLASLPSTAPAEPTHDAALFGGLDGPRPGSDRESAGLGEMWQPVLPAPWLGAANPTVLAMTADGSHLALSQGSEVGVWRIGKDEPVWVANLLLTPVTALRFSGSALWIQQRGGSLVEVEWPRTP